MRTRGGGALERAAACHRLACEPQARRSRGPGAAITPGLLHRSSAHRPWASLRRPAEATLPQSHHPIPPHVFALTWKDSAYLTRDFGISRPRIPGGIGPGRGASGDSITTSRRVPAFLPGRALPGPCASCALGPRESGRSLLSPRQPLLHRPDVSDGTRAVAVKGRSIERPVLRPRSRRAAATARGVPAAGRARRSRRGAAPAR